MRKNSKKTYGSTAETAPKKTAPPAKKPGSINPLALRVTLPTDEDDQSTGFHDWANYFVLVGMRGDSVGFKVARAAARWSRLLPELMGMKVHFGGHKESREGENNGDEVEEEEEASMDNSVIPVQGFDSKTLGLTAQYLNYFAPPELEPTKFPKPFREATVHSTHCSPFEFNFFEQHLEGPANLPTIVGLINVANFLQIQTLLEFASLAVALQLKHKTPGQIRAMFEGVKLPKKDAISGGSGDDDNDDDVEEKGEHDSMVPRESE